MAAVLEAIGGPVHVVGQSSGATVALLAATRSDGVPSLAPCESMLAMRHFPEHLAERVEELVRAGDLAAAADQWFSRMGDTFAPEEIEASRSEPDWQDRVDAAFTISREIQTNAEYSFDPDRFADMTTPTLLLSGGESPPLFKAATEAIDAALPNSRIASFEGHGHFAMWTATDRFVDQVRAFAREANE